MNSHQRRALAVIGGTLALDAVSGVLFARLAHIPVLPAAHSGGGLYWATVTMMTVGYGDVVPRTAAQYWLAIGTILLVIPLGIASITLATAGLTTAHIDRRHAELKRHIERTLGGNDG